MSDGDSGIQERNRLKAILEVVESEKSYVKDLRTIIEVSNIDGLAVPKYAVAFCVFFFFSKKKFFCSFLLLLCYVVCGRCFALCWSRMNISNN
jgi:hypothetical protein